MPDTTNSQENLNRYNFYTKIHKGLRVAQSQLLMRLGSCDFATGEPTATLLNDLKFHLEIASAHLHHEDSFIHTALEARKPGASRQLAHQHDHHAKSFEALFNLIHATEQADGADRSALGHRLYLRFGTYFADDLLHMLEEETVVMPVLHSLFTDAELMDIENQLVAAIPQEKMGHYLKLMAQGINRDERAELFGGVKQAVPSEVFGGILEGIVAPNVSPSDYADLRQRLSLAA